MWHKGITTNITRYLMGHLKNRKSSPRGLGDKKINLLLIKKKKARV